MAGTPLDFARLMWLVEDLVYDDLLKGTGWGRRRGWFREQCEACATLSQVSALAPDLATMSPASCVRRLA